MPLDERSMEEICTPPVGKYDLLVQQKFLGDYISDNLDFGELLMYHQIGSGKTCTAITMAERYMERRPKHQVTVILPARLRTNFIDIHPTIARGKVVVLACLDNLIRGASGVAVQNFNIMNGWCQKTGLDF